MAPLTFTPCSQAWRWASQAREGGQQRRVHVQDAAREGAHEARARAGACSRPGRRGRRRARAGRPRARASWSSRGAAAVVAARGRACPRARARSRPGAPSTLEITTAISPAQLARALRRRCRACRLRAAAADEHADALRRRRGALTRRRRPRPSTTEPITKLVSPRRSSECSTSWRSAGRHHHHHADAHVEGAEHLVVGDGAALLDQAEERRHSQDAAADARAQARRAGRAGCCRGSRRP